jgi:hypothetical protein
MRTGNGGSVMGLMAGAICLMSMASMAGAQAPEGANNQRQVIANGGVLHTLSAPAIIGQPYLAVQVRHTSQKLADGTTISHQGHHSVMRDSQGRVRVERRMAPGQNGGPDVVMVFVLDPVAHTFTTWVQGAKEAAKTAVVVKLPAQQSRSQTKAAPASSANEAGRPQPIVTTEDLGQETMQELPVTVSKTTTIVPAGRSGNDAPITKIHEVWTSPDLELVMKEQWDDPRSGEMTVELDNFSRAEPDPALFRPPAGYAVKDVMQSLKELEEKLGDTQN